MHKDKEFGSYPELQRELNTRLSNEERLCLKMKRRDSSGDTAQWQSTCEP